MKVGKFFSKECEYCVSKYVSYKLAKAIIAECIIYKDMQNVKECCVSEEIDGRDHAYTYIPSPA